MEHEQIITKGKDGKYYNQYGSLCYINVRNAALKRGSKIKEERYFTEFEIQAIAYVNLVKYFKGYKRVRGEYSLGKLLESNYCRADIVILDKQAKNPLVIIEVKRNENEKIISTKQISNYYNFCDKVIVISLMNEAENIVNTIKKLNIV